MEDYGTKLADKTQEELKRKLRKVYGQAHREITAKLISYTGRFNKKDREMAAKLKNGEIDRVTYQNWVNGQVFIGNQWREKLKQITDTLRDANQQSLNLIHGEQMNVFAENYNFQQFQLERDTGLNLSFGIYDKKTVERLLKEEPEMLPRRIVDGKKDEAWNKGIIANTITQGIIQGESLQQIAKRMARDTGEKNMKSMIRYARTAMTCAQNSGRIEMMRDAKSKGVKVKKVWTATLDKRTRDAHQHMDGQVQNVDDPFTSVLGEIMYPGDPDADPANVYNCRCTLTYDYPEFSDLAEDVKRYDNEDGEVIEDMTYDEWKELKEDRRNFVESENEHAHPGIIVSKEAKTLVNSAIELAFEKCEPLRSYLQEVYYTNVSGIASSTKGGRMIKLDKSVFSTPETMKEELEKLVKNGHSVNVTDPRFMVAHELGHCIESMIIAQKLNLQRNSLGALQLQMMNNERISMGIEYFNHMGFENINNDKAIYGIIEKELGTRALDDTSEMFAQAFAQTLYGEGKAPHAEKLVDYVISLVR